MLDQVDDLPTSVHVSELHRSLQHLDEQLQHMGKEQKHMQHVRALGPHAPKEVPCTDAPARSPGWLGLTCSERPFFHHTAVYSTDQLLDKHTAPLDNHHWTPCKPSTHTLLQLASCS